MALRIEAIASYCGLKGIFKLLAADIYEVLSVEAAEDERARSAGGDGRRRPRADPVFTMKALQDLSTRIHRADSLERLLDSILAGLEESFGFEHSMILRAADEEGVLVTIASRGYPETGVGAEVRFGEGIIGMVAEARKPIRISGLMRGMLYALRRARSARRKPGLCAARSPDSAAGLAQPGEPARRAAARARRAGRRAVHRERDAVPLPRGGQDDDRAARQLPGDRDPEHAAAGAVGSGSPRQRGVEPRTDAASAAVPRPPRRNGKWRTTRATSASWSTASTLIRSLPARILWKLLRRRDAEGRAEFTNRELRLDKSLNLPEWKDNLETRLLLLRRRLEEKCPDIRIVPRGRGRFALELGCNVTLVERP